MKKVVLYSLLVIGLASTFGSCGLFRGKKERCPAYTSVQTEVSEDLALTK